MHHHGGHVPNSSQGTDEAIHSNPLGRTSNIPFNQTIDQENPFCINTIIEVLSPGSITNGKRPAVKWPIMNASRSYTNIPAITQTGVIKMATTELTKVMKMVEKSPCQGVKFTFRINKENYSSEQAIELTNLLIKIRC